MVSLYIFFNFMYNRTWKNRDIYKREKLETAWLPGFARE